MSTPPRTSPLALDVVDAFEAITRALKRRTMDDWVELDLTMAQLKTLFTLEYDGPVTIGQTGERLGISLPTASHLIDRLVQGGYVARTEDPADRRRTLASTTARGSELVTRLRQGGRDSLVDWIEQMDDETVRSLVKGATALAEIAQRSVDSASETCDDVAPAR